MPGDRALAWRRSGSNTATARGLTGLVPRPQLKGVLDRRMRVGLSEEAEYAYMPRGRPSNRP